MNSKVTILKTGPETVIDDYGRLLRESGCTGFVKPDRNTVLKINLSWDLWFPACSTAPWQLEGVCRALVEDGYDAASIIPADSGCGGIDHRRAERNNGLTTAVKRLGIGITCLEEPPVNWICYRSRAPLPAIDQIYPEGILVPDFFPGSNIIHLPTMKTHARDFLAGAMQNAMGGLERENARLRNAGVDDLLVDLLALQQELHSGIFNVVDGVFCGDGPGPRALTPYEKGYILAGADPVAVDAVIARMMGFDPLSIGYIRKAHERGLGCGDISEIEIAGEDIAAINYQFDGPDGGGLGSNLLSARSLLPARAADLLQDYCWYPYSGWIHLNQIAETRWGQLLQDYLPEDAALDRQGKGKGSLAGIAAAGLFATAALVGLRRRL
ncbi:MAG: DUF362 domain-containing protein [Thermoleophilia bacterium]